MESCGPETSLAPPPDLSIILLSVRCVSFTVSLTATKVQSSTKPVESSFLPLAVSMRSAL